MKRSSRPTFWRKLNRLYGITNPLHANLPPIIHCFVQKKHYLYSSTICILNDSIAIEIYNQCTCKYAYFIICLFFKCLPPPNHQTTFVSSRSSDSPRYFILFLIYSHPTDLFSTSSSYTYSSKQCTYGSFKRIRFI